MAYNGSGTYARDEQKRAHAQRAVRHPEHYAHLQQKQAGQDGLHSMPAHEGTLASSVALLGSPGLRARSNDHVRIAVMQRMQSTYGNRATRQFVQRASQSSPVVVQRGVFGWLRKKFGKLVGKGRGRSRRREAPPPAAEPQERTGGHYGGIPGKAASHYGGMPAKAPGQPQPQPEATPAEEMPAAGPGTQFIAMPGPAVGQAGQPQAEAAALPAATAATLGAPTATTAAQAVDMAQKQVVKYRLVKAMYQDPEHQGEEQQSLIAANLYEKRLENLDNLTNQLNQVHQAIEQARSQGAHQQVQQLEQYYRQLWDDWAFYNGELRQWLWKHEIDPNKIYEYKVKYIRDESEREELELKGGDPLKQGKPPNERVYDTSRDFSVFSGIGWAIYVMSPDGKIYAHSHKISRFHHSSFLAGGDVAGAGEIKVNNGKLTGITNKSGHYRPGPEYLVQVLKEFRERGTGLSGVYLKAFFTDAQGNVQTDDSRDAQKFLEDEEHRLGQGAGAGAGGGGAPSVVR